MEKVNISNVTFNLKHKTYGEANVVLAYKKGDFTTVGFFDSEGDYHERILQELIKEGWLYDHKQDKEEN